MGKLLDKDHPIWKTIQFGVTIGSLALFLRFNYNTFDERDLKTIGGTVVAYLLAQFAPFLLPGNKNQNPPAA